MNQYYFRKRTFVIVLFFTTVNLGIAVAKPPLSVGKGLVIGLKSNDLVNSDILIVHLSQPVSGAYGKEDVAVYEKFSREYESRKYVASPINGNVRIFVPNMAEPYLISLDFISKTYKKSFHFSFISNPGDSIFIEELGDSLRFTGQSSDNYTCQLQLSNILNSSVLNVARKEYSVEIFNNLVDSLTKESLRVLDQFVGRIDNQNVWLYRANILSSFFNLKMNLLKARRDEPLEIGDADVLNSSYRTPVWIQELEFRLNKQSLVRHALFYLDFLVNQYSYEFSLKNGAKLQLKEYFEYFENKFNGSVREWIIFKIVKQNSKPTQELGRCIDRIFKGKYIQNLSIRSYLLSIIDILPGKAAFNFCLENQKGEFKRLADFKGKVVLMDFWFRGCSSCAELKPYLDSIRNVFKLDNFVVIGICLDYQGHGKSKWKEIIKSNIYTDVDQTNLYSKANINGVFFDQTPIIKHYHIKGCPTLILINKRGILSNQPEDPRYDGGASMCNLINFNLNN